jgi:hypothetical protein
MLLLLVIVNYRVDFRNQDPKSLAGLARGARAAIVVPSLIALTLLAIKQPQMAGFAIYGSFDHLRDKHDQMKIPLVTVTVSKNRQKVTYRIDGGPPSVVGSLKCLFIASPR